MSEPTYLHDGFTRKGYIKAVPGLHGPLRFEFRPLMVEERDAWMVQSSKAGPLGEAKATARIMASRLQAWDLKDAEGKPVPRTAENVLRLPVHTYSRLVGIIAGHEATDLDEENPTPPDDLSGEAETILFPASQLQAEQQKNLSAG